MLRWIRPVLDSQNKYLSTEKQQHYKLRQRKDKSAANFMYVPGHITFIIFASILHL